MPQTSPQHGYATPDEAEEAFYNAFAACDMAGMAHVWGDGDVVCIHPGAPPLLDRASILASWFSIFENVAPPQLEVLQLQTLATEDQCVHVVEERLLAPDGGDVIVLASNVFRRSDSGWLMVGHHASLQPKFSDLMDTPDTLQ